MTRRLDRVPEPRDGFTLLELLIVCAVVGTLVALLLPAVQRVRETARRNACANNLHQLALAVHHYESVYGCLPSGSKGPRNSDGTFPTGWYDPVYGPNYPWGHFGWPALLLPYLDDDALSERINFTVPAFAASIPFANGTDRGPAGSPINAYAANNMPRVFTCPSAHRAKPRGEFKDYAINYGSGIDRGLIAQDGPERALVPLDGVAWINSDVQFKDVTDGLSSTILLIESANFGSHNGVPSEVGTNPFFWIDLNAPGYAAACDPDGTPAPPNVTTFSNRGAHSDHPLGVQAALVDGHVIWIPNSIDFTVYQALFTRAGGEIIPDF